MAMDFYTTGFLEKIAAYEKAADYASTLKARQAVRDQEKRDAGIEDPEPYVKPTTFKGTVKQRLGRAGTYMNSLARGLGSGAMSLLYRTGQGALDLATFGPRLLDTLLLGKLVGVDEGRGMFGRMYGNLERYFDKKVHDWRTWSSDYDEKNRIKGGFNRFLNGRAADTLGGFLGWGGWKKGLMNRLMGGFGGYGGFSSDGQQGQLRQREAWIRSLSPLDRLRVDPTSTAYNQENAPTAAEYQRYHLPSYNLPTSSTGMIRVPYAWMHQTNDRPVNFRDFGT